MALIQDSCSQPSAAPDSFRQTGCPAASSWRGVGLTSCFLPEYRYARTADLACAIVLPSLLCSFPGGLLSANRLWKSLVSVKAGWVFALKRGDNRERLIKAQFEAHMCTYSMHPPPNHFY